MQYSQPSRLQTWCNLTYLATDYSQDPERRPLVVVTLPEGTSVNAWLIQRGLAQP